MGMLIKYDLKGNFKKFFIMLMIMAILNIALLLKVNAGSNGMNSIFAGLLVTLNVVFNFAALLICLNDFQRELYDDRAYLTFTLPVNGKQIIGSKVISTFIWLFITAALSVIFILMLLGGTGEINFSLLKINQNIVMQIIITLVYMFIDSFIFICLAYFAMILPKMANLNVKLGKFLGGLIFIGLMVGLTYVNVKICVVFPKEMVINSVSGVSVRIPASDGMELFLVTGKETMINIAGFIYSVVLSVVLFVTNSYLVENRLDIK
ncbi:hypothetical protein ACER0A_000930 [Haloimpatiens sp. FM7315]|uniref:hypothetical protein n=1 Tax=Haloimpatiens sp. FM7315 TaxID=3298609 RepID=UPI0035A2BE17